MVATTSPSHQQHGPFKDHPQKFPRAQRSASRLADAMHGMMKKGPRSLVGTVVDASFQVTAGFVLCTTQLGVVKVYGVPYGSVVPQMRLFVRQAGPHGTNKQFVFDGYAPALSSLGLTSGSLIMSSPVGDSGSLPAPGATLGITTVASITTAAGYYWCCFFYLPALPTTSRVTLFSMDTSAQTNIVSLEYLSNGSLVFRSTNSIPAQGYITTNPVSPHTFHWLLIQPGIGTGQDVLLDGLPVAYKGIAGLANERPVFSSAGANYTLYLLSNYDGSATPPLGTWISKIGFGTSWTGSAVIPLITGIGGVPASDSDLPNANVSTSQQAIGLYLCEDTPGGSTLTNGALSGLGGGLTVTSPYATISAIGPY